MNPRHTAPTKMLPFLALSLTFLGATGVSGAAAPAITAVAVLPAAFEARQDSGPRCALLEDETFGSSVRGCFAGFVGTKTACEYADNDAWIFHETGNNEQAQACICPAYQDIVDQCLGGCPRHFNTAISRQFSSICEGGQASDDSTDADTAVTSVTTGETGSLATSTGTGTEASPTTGGSGASETAQSSGEATGEPDSAGTKPAMPWSLALACAVCMASVLL